MTTTSVTGAPALTTLSEDEEMFRSAVRDFAQAEVAPRVAAMERASEYDRALIPKFAQLGLMGIDVPEELGGAGGTVFVTMLAGEGQQVGEAARAIVVEAKRRVVDARRIL